MANPYAALKSYNARTRGGLSARPATAGRQIASWNAQTALQGGTNAKYGQATRTARPGAAAGGAGDPGLAQLMSAAPYQALANQAGGMLQSGIRGNAASFLDQSPAFRGMNPAAVAELNRQAGDRASDLRNQSMLAYTRRMGTEVPQLQLDQILGFRGLENARFGAQNDYLGVQTDANYNPLLRLLGALV